MPNWTTNYLACHEDDLNRIVNGQGEVDFNLAIPMPKELDITESSIMSYALRAYRGEGLEDLAKMLARGPFTYQDAECEPHECKKASTMDELKALGTRYIENQKKYGAMTWYNWCTRNWGTKWNACDTKIEEAGRWRIIRFDTAWNQPAASLIAKAFEGSKHGFIFEAFDEGYSGIFGLGYEPRKPVLLTEAEGRDDDFEYPVLACCDDLNFEGIASESIGRFYL